MSLWVIDKHAMATFVTNLMADYRVAGPVAKGDKFAFGQIEDPADLQLGYNTSILPPKKYLQPQEERLMTFNRAGKNNSRFIGVFCSSFECSIDLFRIMTA